MEPRLHGHAHGREGEAKHSVFLSRDHDGVGNLEVQTGADVFILCGAAGLRIGEALGLEIDKHISPDFLTISIQQKARHGKVEKRLKTASAFRKVDLRSEIAAALKEFAGDRKYGF